MDYVEYQKKDKIAYIMLDRSEYNPINYEMVDELDVIWKDFQKDDQLFVAIMGSNHKNFSVGFDIVELKEKIFAKGNFCWSKSAQFGSKRHCPDIQSVKKPIVAAIDGIVNGGAMWLFLQSDIRVATSKAVFGLAEGKLNFPVEFTGFLTRYMPRAIINEMLLSGKNITAKRFYEMGIVNKIVKQEDLMGEAVKFAKNIIESGPISLRIMKELVHYGYEMDYHGLMALSSNMIVPVVNSKDTRDAINSFLEKRKPVWKTK